MVLEDEVKLGVEESRWVDFTRVNRCSFSIPELIDVPLAATVTGCKRNFR